MLSAVKATGDDDTIPVEIQYEDVNGNKFTEKTEINLAITEQAETLPGDSMDDVPNSRMPENHTSSVPLVVGAVVAALIIGGIVVKIKKKGKNK